ncbi:hypothetical protein SAMN04488004_107214 [Loktanella salsilacus]|uniref:Uncharacterized protein n=2 Tax=Loktanella salsilacus TaxID=195913 RepID=A0A1I4EVF9_9RHOB|nr:hypothetical protein SAMN04488004_107214 [Loktanella salsilacus]
MKSLQVMRKFDLLTPEQDDRIRAEGEQSVFSNLPVREAEQRAFFKNASLKDAEVRLNWLAAEEFVNQREAQEIQTAIEAKYDPEIKRICDMLDIEE